MSFDWAFLGHLLFHPPGSFVQGAIRTIYLAVVAQALGVALGLLGHRRLGAQRNQGAEALLTLVRRIPHGPRQDV